VTETIVFATKTIVFATKTIVFATKTIVFVTETIFSATEKVLSEQRLLLSAGFLPGLFEIQVRLVIGMLGALGFIQQAFDGEQLHAWELPAMGAFVKVLENSPAIDGLSLPTIGSPAAPTGRDSKAQGAALGSRNKRPSPVRAGQSRSICVEWV
jgi:hypothetical protein